MLPIQRWCCFFLFILFYSPLRGFFLIKLPLEFMWTFIIYKNVKGCHPVFNLTLASFAVCLQAVLSFPTRKWTSDPYLPPVSHSRFHRLLSYAPYCLLSWLMSTSMEACPYFPSISLLRWGDQSAQSKCNSTMDINSTWYYPVHSPFFHLIINY